MALLGKKPCFEILKLKGVQNGIFQVFSKTSAWNFSFFLLKVLVAQRLLIDLNDFFFRKTLFRSFFGKMEPKWSQNEAFQVL